MSAENWMCTAIPKLDYAKIILQSQGRAALSRTAIWRDTS